MADTAYHSSQEVLSGIADRLPSGLQHSWMCWQWRVVPQGCVWTIWRLTTSWVSYSTWRENTLISAKQPLFRIVTF